MVEKPDTVDSYGLCRAVLERMGSAIRLITLSTFSMDGFMADICSFRFLVELHQSDRAFEIFAKPMVVTANVTKVIDFFEETHGRSAEKKRNCQQNCLITMQKFNSIVQS